MCKDEDDMASNSATMLATQQSIKAYVDAVDVPTTRNLLINGAMEVAQKGGGSHTTAGQTYWVDRFYTYSARSVKKQHIAYTTDAPAWI